MADRGLIERLLLPQRAATATVDTGAVTDSVVRNLREVFNARQGCCLTRDDFGLPEFGDLMHGFPQVIPEIVRAIRHQLEQFEPRLTDVQVRHYADESNASGLRFSIRAMLLTDADATPVVLSGELGADGHLDVRP